MSVVTGLNFIFSFCNKLGGDYNNIIIIILNDYNILQMGF